MALITVDELKTELDNQGVDYSDYEEQLEQLLNSTINKLQGLTGLSINPQERDVLIFEYTGRMLQFDFYPVQCVNQLCIDEKIIEEEKYVLDCSLGVLYFKDIMDGTLKCKYTTYVPEDIIDSLVNPLLVDMLSHDINKGFNWEGEYSTVKEGDVSISYDTSTGLYSSINDRINNLKFMYSGRAKLL